MGCDNGCEPARTGTGSGNWECKILGGSSTRSLSLALAEPIFRLVDLEHESFKCDKNKFDTRRYGLRYGRKID